MNSSTMFPGRVIRVAVGPDMVGARLPGNGYYSVRDLAQRIQWAWEQAEAQICPSG